ncbi:MAG: phosphatidylglycerophosphatase A [Candidatus Marinimicrobia bacterium]|nr:phosphatidylglycerophosphatase A [Candidatus Neomarinimicrobiota bacterium]|tara:strand:- start:230 stop:685 length:456 start_codon:yes stop_codon:yes gene_type:complete
MKLKISEIIGTVFYVGRSPFAPGTMGSLIALLAWFILKPLIIDPLFLLITGGLFFIGIAVSTILIEAWNKKDPKEIVIDEWVGMWISLYLVPHTIVWGFIAFFFFRLFDILKPGPVQMMDDMDDSIGVMMDDVVAGILACLVTQSLLYFNQ